jgi:hypothetical protein
VFRSRHTQPSKHIGTIELKNGSPRPNLEPFLEPFIAESTPKTPECSA